MMFLLALLCTFEFIFFFNDTATTEIYTLSLHDALPICPHDLAGRDAHRLALGDRAREHANRSEEHTSELQSPCNLVCRLLLEKKNLGDIENFARRWLNALIDYDDAKGTDLVKTLGRYLDNGGRYVATALVLSILFFFIDSPIPEIYTLSLHDALPI